MAFCENCGKTVEPGIKFCENCGVPIDDPSTTQPTNSQEPAQVPTFQGSPAPTAPPASSPIPPIYIAVGIAIVVIIIALAFASGVMSGPHDPVVPPTVTVTPTKTVTPTITTSTPKPTTALSKDPIIGAWSYSGIVFGDWELYIYRFYGNGTFIESANGSGSNYVHYGTWSAKGSNSYQFIYQGQMDPKIMVYDPERNAIYEYPYGDVKYYPYLGDVASA